MSDWAEPTGLELRAVPVDVADLRADDNDGPHIVGYASVYGVETDLGYHTEEVAVGAWANSILRHDIRCMLNHDTNQLLGRTKPGTLKLSSDDHGLRFDVTINEQDPAAVGAWARVQRGDIDGASVWFRATKTEVIYPDESNGREYPHRRILEGSLYEAGPVVFPAFEQTVVQARSLDPLDSALAAAGVGDAKRTALIVETLTDPAKAGDALRSLFVAHPEVRDAACSCSGPAVSSVPAVRDVGGTPDLHRLRRDLLDRRAAPRVG